MERIYLVLKRGGQLPWFTALKRAHDVRQYSLSLGGNFIPQQSQSLQILKVYKYTSKTHHQHQHQHQDNGHRHRHQDRREPDHIQHGTAGDRPGVEGEGPVGGGGGASGPQEGGEGGDGGGRGENRGAERVVGGGCGECCCCECRGGASPL
ncbi:hypothetical protein DL98DRAFT_651654 [Cadophora sp. DSE1049]|nr:hypothetical protein DL98DRAFT_651654 [Cadophora sp. DSE1049]